MKELPDFREKFEIGFATLLKTPEAFRVLASGRTFNFSDHSEYAAMAVGDDQEKALRAYSKMSGIPVYYLLARRQQHLLV